MPRSSEVLSSASGLSKSNDSGRQPDHFSAPQCISESIDSKKTPDPVLTLNATQTMEPDMTDENDTPPDIDQPSEEFKIDIDPRIGESLQGGMDALGKVFGGLVGAIKDAVGPELMRSMEVASWLGQLASCLDDMASGLKSNNELPAESSGQFAFYVEQFSSSLDGSRLASQKASLQLQLENARQAVASAVSDPDASAGALAQASGYFKAAAASLVPIQSKEDQSS